MSKDFDDLWKFSIDEQKELVGTDIGQGYPIIVVELDEWSTRMMYNERYAPITIRQYECRTRLAEVFQIVINSIDDAAYNILWEVKKMDYRPDEVREQIDNWLKRTNYFVNIIGFLTFCNIFGKYEENHN